MSALQPFIYGSQAVRTYLISNEAWFVATDVCNILELSNPTIAVSRLDEDERSKFNLGRQGEATVVNESGLYSLILGSRKPEAKNFKRWITHEVLPSIRKTGSYSVENLTGPDLMARALVEAHATIEQSNQRVLEYKARADAWDSFLSTKGDYSMNEAAKLLARHKNIQIGERRLRTQLFEWNWLYRQSGDPRAYQAHIDNGRLAERANYYTDTQTGERITTSPQVRITPKGLDTIAKKLLEVMK